jgi:hypothetical protein
MSLLKTGACFTAELELNCPTIVACVAALPTGPVASPGTLVLGADGQYHALPPIGADAVFGTTVLLGNDGQYHALPSPSAAATDCAAVAACIAALPVGPTAVFGTTALLGADGQYHALPIPAAAAVTFATPAQTIAGTSAVLAVNPADLYARENIAAQTGLGLVLSAIPAPTAAQSVWGVNTLGETLHYAPGLGWQIVNKYFHSTQSVDAAAAIPIAANIVTPISSFVAPRAGLVAVTAQVTTTSPTCQSQAGGITVSGVLVAFDNTSAYDLVGTAGASMEARGNNASTAWYGRVAAGTVISSAGVIIGSSGTAYGTLTVTYLGD